MSDYIIDPSNQQGQPQYRKGPVGSPTHNDNARLVPADDQPIEGPEEIPDHPGTPGTHHVSPVPMPDHPGEGAPPILDRLGKPILKPSQPMGAVIGKDDRLLSGD